MRWIVLIVIGWLIFALYQDATDPVRQKYYADKEACWYDMQLGDERVQCLQTNSPNCEDLAWIRYRKCISTIEEQWEQANER